MVETLQNLEPLFAKWQNNSPYAQNGRISKTCDSTQADDAISKGLQAWKTKFPNGCPPRAPPPPHRARRRNHNNGINSNFDFHINNSALQLGGTFKSSPSVMPGSAKVRPFAGRCCDCMPESKNYFFTENIKFAGISDVLKVKTNSRDYDWWTRTFYHISFVLQTRLTHRYPDLSVAVLTSNRLTEAVQRSVAEEAEGKLLSEKKLAQLQAKMLSRAKEVLQRMSAGFSNKLIRFTGWFLHKLLGRLLSVIIVHKGQIQMLQHICKKQVPVIFLPTHRSHLDYILMTFVLFNYEIKAPYVAAGDNLLIPFFGSLMRGLGGFFIRRKLDHRNGKKDLIYRAVLHTYMEEVLRCNEFMEFFIEGGRTRSGKATHPKSGLLSVIVDAFNAGVIPEAYLVPVSISYDKLLDGNFVKEQMGEPKVYETFWRATTAIYRAVMGKYGAVRIDFAQPFSLREFLQVSRFYPTSEQSNISESMEVIPRIENGDVVRKSSDNSICTIGNEVRPFVHDLALHVVYESVQSQSILGTQLLAFLLLVDFRQGVELDVLIKSFDAMKQEVIFREHDLSFCGETRDVIAHAQQLMTDRLIRKETVTKRSADEESRPDCKESTTIRLVPVVELPHVLELSYYSNVVGMVFATESVLANALYSMVEPERWTMCNGLNSPIQVSKELLISESVKLCNLLKYEYIFAPPCQTVSQALNYAFDRMRNSSLLNTEEELNEQEEENEDVRDKMWAKRFAASYKRDYGDESDDDDDDWNIQDEICTVSQDRDLMQKLHFLKKILSPILETYYVVASHLVRLLKDDIPENDLTKSIHKALKDRVSNGMAYYAESVALDTLKNAIGGFENIGVLTRYQAAGVAMVSLRQEYGDDASLHGFIRQLESFRD